MTQRRGRRSVSEPRVSGAASPSVHLSHAVSSLPASVVHYPRSRLLLPSSPADGEASLLCARMEAAAIAASAGPDGGLRRQQPAWLPPTEQLRVLSCVFDAFAVGVHDLPARVILARSGLLPAELSASPRSRRRRIAGASGRRASLTTVPQDNRGRLARGDAVSADELDVPVTVRVLRAGDFGRLFEASGLDGAPLLNGGPAARTPRGLSASASRLRSPTAAAASQQRRAPPGRLRPESEWSKITGQGTLRAEGVVQADFYVFCRWLEDTAAAASGMPPRPVGQAPSRSSGGSTPRGGRAGASGSSEQDVFSGSSGFLRQRSGAPRSSPRFRGGAGGGSGTHASLAAASSAGAAQYGGTSTSGHGSAHAGSLSLQLVGMSAVTAGSSMSEVGVAEGHDSGAGWDGFDLRAEAGLDASVEPEERWRSDVGPAVSWLLHEHLFRPQVLGAHAFVLQMAVRASPVLAAQVEAAFGPRKEDGGAAGAAASGAASSSAVAGRAAVPTDSSWAMPVHQALSLLRRVDGDAVSPAALAEQVRERRDKQTEARRKAALDRAETVARDVMRGAALRAAAVALVCPFLQEGIAAAEEDAEVVSGWWERRRRASGRGLSVRRGATAGLAARARAVSGRPARAAVAVGEAVTEADGPDAGRPEVEDDNIAQHGGAWAVVAAETRPPGQAAAGTDGTDSTGSVDGTSGDAEAAAADAEAEAAAAEADALAVEAARAAVAGGARLASHDSSVSEGPVLGWGEPEEDDGAVAPQSQAEDAVSAAPAQPAGGVSGAAEADGWGPVPSSRSWSDDDDAKQALGPGGGGHVSVVPGAGWGGRPGAGGKTGSAATELRTAEPAGAGDAVPGPAAGRPAPGSAAAGKSGPLTPRPPGAAAGPPPEQAPPARTACSRECRSFWAAVGRALALPFRVAWRGIVIVAMALQAAMSRGVDAVGRCLGRVGSTVARGWAALAAALSPTPKAEGEGDADVVEEEARLAEEEAAIRRAAAEAEKHKAELEAARVAEEQLAARERAREEAREAQQRAAALAEAARHTTEAEAAAEAERVREAKAAMAAQRARRAEGARVAAERALAEAAARREETARRQREEVRIAAETARRAEETRRETAEAVAEAEIAQLEADEAIAAAVAAGATFDDDEAMSAAVTKTKRRTSLFGQLTRAMGVGRDAMTVSAAREAAAQAWAAAEKAKARIGELRAAEALRQAEEEAAARVRRAEAMEEERRRAEEDARLAEEEQARREEEELEARRLDEQARRPKTPDIPPGPCLADQSDSGGDDPVNPLPTVVALAVEGALPAEVLAPVPRDALLTPDEALARLNHAHRSYHLAARRRRRRQQLAAEMGDRAEAGAGQGGGEANIGADLSGVVVRSRAAWLRGLRWRHVTRAVGSMLAGRAELARRLEDEVTAEPPADGTAASPGPAEERHPGHRPSMSLVVVAVGDGGKSVATPGTLTSRAGRRKRFDLPDAPPLGPTDTMGTAGGWSGAAGPGRRAEDGGSKDDGEDDSKLHVSSWSLANLMGVLEPVIEFFTISAVAFRGYALALWSLPSSRVLLLMVQGFLFESPLGEYLEAAGVTATAEDQASAGETASGEVVLGNGALPLTSFKLMFWASVSIALVFPLYSLRGVRRAREGTLGTVRARDGRRVPAPLLSLEGAYQQLLSLMGGIGFFFVIKTLLGVLACDYATEGSPLYQDPTIPCWRDLHLAWVAMAVVGGLLYYPLATFIAPSMAYANPSLDVKYSLDWTVVSTQSKLLLSAALVFFPGQAELAFPSAAAAAVGVSLSVVLFTRRPCLVDRVNVWRGYLLLLGAWPNALVLLMLAGVPAATAQVMLLVGWGVGFVAAVLMDCGGGSHSTGRAAAWLCNGCARTGADSPQAPGKAPRNADDDLSEDEGARDLSRQPPAVTVL